MWISRYGRKKTPKNCWDHHHWVTMGNPNSSALCHTTISSLWTFLSSSAHSVRKKQLGFYGSWLCRYFIILFTGSRSKGIFIFKDRWMCMYYIMSCPLANSRGIFIFFKYSNIQTSKNIMFIFILLDTFRYCQFG